MRGADRSVTFDYIIFNISIKIDDFTLKKHFDG